MTSGQRIAKGFGLALACLITLSILAAIVSGTVAIMDREGVIRINDYTWHFGSSDSEPAAGDFVESIDDIRSIVADTGADALYIQTGSTNSVETFNLTENYDISCDNGKLEIMKKSEFDIVDWLFDGHLFNSSTSKIVVTVKEGSILDRVDLDTGSGKVFVSNIATGQLEIDGGSGFITLDGISAGRTNLSIGSGGLDAVRIKTSTLILDSGSGGVTFEDSHFGDMKLDTGSGRLACSGTVDGNIDLSSGSGSVTMELKGDETRYSLDCDAGSGGIYINGNKMDSISTKGSSYHIKIDGGSGRVTLDFK